MFPPRTVSPSYQRRALCLWSSPVAYCPAEGTFAFASSMLDSLVNLNFVFSGYLHTFKNRVRNFPPKKTDDSHHTFYHNMSSESPRPRHRLFRRSTGK